MKKTIIILIYTVCAYTANAQTTVTSKALGDLISIQKSAFEITPIVVTVKGDTARSMSWYVVNMPRDTTVGFNVVYALYDKSGAQLATDFLQFPGNLFTKWGALINRIDNYILNQRKRLSKQ